MAKSTRKFNYKPRFQDNNTDTSDTNVKAGWENLKQSRTRKKSIFGSPIFLVLFLITVLIVIYVLSQYE